MTKKHGLSEHISLEDIIAKLPGHVYWKDCNGVLLGCNQQQAEDAGFSSPDEFIGKTDFDMPWYSYAPEIQKNDQHVVTTGQPLTVREGSHLSHKVPLHSKEGDVIGVLGISLDLNNYQVAVEGANHTLDEIISLLPGHVYWKDRDGIILGCNNQQAKDLGLASRHDIVGKTDYEVIYSTQSEEQKRSQAAETTRIDQEVMQANTELQREESIIDSNGKRIYYWSTKVPLHDKEGKVDGLVGFSVDVTELKLAQEQLKLAKESAESANRSKSEFIANISHDFVTALTSILGLTDLLLEKKVDEAAQQDCLIDIHTASSTLLQLINDIIEFTKLEHEVKRVHEDLIDLTQLIDNVRTLVDNRAEQKGLELIIQSDCSQLVISDKNRLTRILMNLVGNAIKFTDKGKVGISVKLLPHVDDGTGVIHIAVSDSGIGIPKEKQQFIFERFSRVDPTYHGHESGAGLGLNIVKRLVDDFGGTIEVESQLHQGTTFTLEIPCRLASREVVQQSNATKEPQAVTLRFNSRILLVEDNPIIQRVTKQFLEDLGCVVDCAETGEQALQMVSAQHDLVLLDIGLPDRDGLQVAQEIRQQKDIKINNVPIVAHTAHLAAEDRQKALATGMNEFLTKPTNKIVLAEVLTRFLKPISL